MICEDANMKASDWDCFILSSLKRGYCYREIAACINYSISAVALRVIALRQQFGAKNRRDLLEMIR